MARKATSSEQLEPDDYEWNRLVSLSYLLFYLLNMLKRWDRWICLSGRDLLNDDSFDLSLQQA